MNLVLEVERADGTVVFVHSVPISREVFKRYYKVIGRAFSDIVSNVGYVMGPRVGALSIRSAAEELGVASDVERGLLAEIKRLTNVAIPTDKGWERLPYHEVESRKLLDADDLEEVENAVAFFTLASSATPSRERRSLGSSGNFLGSRIVSSDFTEFASSLPTSTPDEPTGATATT
jgi:hypothetical protein